MFDKATELQVNTTKAWLQELRGLAGDEVVYDELYRAIDPESYLAYAAAKELSGITCHDNNHDLQPWEKVCEIEFKLFGTDKSTPLYQKFQEDLCRLTVDKMEKEIHMGLPYEEWAILNDTVLELIASIQRTQRDTTICDDIHTVAMAITEARTQHLQTLWNDVNEQRGPAAWRDDLTPQEQALVAKWDETRFPHWRSEQAKKDVGFVESLSSRLANAQQTCTQRNNTAAPAHDHKKPEPER